MGKILRSGGANYRGPGIEVTPADLERERAEHERSDWANIEDFSFFWFQGLDGGGPQPVEHLKYILPAKPEEIPFTIVEVTSVQDLERIAQQPGVVVLHESGDDRRVAAQLMDMLADRHLTEDIAPVALIAPPEGMSEARIRSWFEHLFKKDPA